MRSLLFRSPMGVLAAALLMVWILSAFTLDCWGKTRAPRGRYDAILVAGCRVYPNGKPSPALEWRVRKAVELWKHGAAPRVLFTGGVGHCPPAEAEASAQLASELGLPASATLLETRSTSTYENARYAAQLLSDPRSRRILLVTDAYHVFRARRIFSDFFGEVDAVGSTYGVASRVRGALREVLALLKYAVVSLRGAAE
jgi:uncharacterized SAM-binding protein YcdF (DUF218 family)